MPGKVDKSADSPAHRSRAHCCGAAGVAPANFANPCLWGRLFDSSLTALERGLGTAPERGSETGFHQRIGEWTGGGVRIRVSEPANDMRLSRGQQRNKAITTARARQAWRRHVSCQRTRGCPARHWLGVTGTTGSGTVSSSLLLWRVILVVLVVLLVIRVLLVLRSWAVFLDGYDHCPALPAPLC